MLYYLVQDHYARAESKGFDEWDATTVASCAAKPQPAISTLFMPKWRVLPYTMSALERADAISWHQRHAAEKEHSFPGFFRFGIRYRPDANARNVFRTVVIDNLPPRFALSTLLVQIKGGAVLDAKLLNTTGIHGRTSAMITFVHEQAAKALEDRAHSHPFHFNGLQARVVLLPSPTWPMAPALQTRILHHGHTRCLQVHGFPRSSSSIITPGELERDLHHLCRPLTSSHGIEAKTLRADGVLELRFTAVLYAAMARRVLMREHRYRHCVCQHLPDPCAQPWDDDGTLEGPEKDQELCGKQQPEDPNHGVIDVAAVPGWKEYAYESFTGIPTLPEEARLDDPEDRTFRLSDAGIEDSATMQRGRGFSSKQSSVTKSEDTCNPQ